jgi:hypothetical protein
MKNTVNKARAAAYKKLSKLLDDFSVAELKDLLDECAEDQRQYIAYKFTFSNDKNAVNWFTKFCESLNLTPVRKYITDNEGNEIPYGLYYVKEFNLTGYCKETGTYEPYFQLWIKDGHQNEDQTPHIEMGADYLNDIWWSPANMKELELQMTRLAEMRVFAKKGVDSTQ